MNSIKTNYLEAQFVIFYKQIIEKPEDLWIAINKELKNFFDQTPLIVPVPNEAQLNEFPVVQANSSKGVRLTISRSKLVLYFDVKSKEETFKNNKKEICDKSTALIKLLDSNINWIGLISLFFIQTDKPAILISNILDKEFKKIHEGSVLESTVDFISTVVFENRRINNHTQLLQGKLAFKGEKEDNTGLVITRDFNTRPQSNDDNYINADFTKLFIDYVETHFSIDKITKNIWI
jgi:hypothetical protein